MRQYKYNPQALPLTKHCVQITFPCGTIPRLVLLFLRASLLDCCKPLLFREHVPASGRNPRLDFFRLADKLGPEGSDHSTQLIRRADWNHLL